MYLHVIQVLSYTVHCGHVTHAHVVIGNGCMYTEFFIVLSESYYIACVVVCWYPEFGVSS